jgi:uracil-DNA glycosylase family 4
MRLQYLEAMGIDVWVPRTLADHEQSFAVIDNADKALRLTEPEAEDPRWDSLQAEVAACTKCSLCKTRTQTVFGAGSKHAEWMVIGEAPGQSEDQQGLPFVGNAGLLLTEMLRAIGLARDEVFIANILKCRPPGNRDPKPDEIEACSDYLQRQQTLIKPKIILAVGRIAAQALLKSDEPLAKLRGKVHTLNDTPVVVVYHPAYLLRSLIEKRKAWLDLQLAEQTYKNNKG